MDAAAVLDGLDDEQRAVAEAVHGPVAVIAGAGSGKTRAITHRIAYAVRSGAHDPRRSLAVTFTTRAAGEMRSRLAGLGIEGVQVRTFHAAALRQLRYFWPRLSGGSFPDILPSKARLVAQSAQRVGLPTDNAAVRDLAADLEWAKVSFLSGDAIGPAALGAQRTLAADATSVARVLAAYEEIKDDRGLLDFEDVLLVMAGALGSAPDIADEVRRTYRWFTVDEYQDVNALQQHLLDLWLGGRDDLCVVGDPNQTIYTFTGASDRHLREFAKRYPDATTVVLDRCYRSTPQIVGLANAIIGSDAGLVLRSQRPTGPEPTIEVLPDEEAEAHRVVERVREHLAAGIAGRDIAVLFRINAQSAVLEEAFAEAGVPVVLRGTERFFDRPEVREAVTRLRGAAKAAEVGSVVDETAAVLATMGWLAEAPRSTGAVRERWESLAALATLAEELRGLSLAAFIEEIDARAQLAHAPVADGVTLSSIHSAKGLEWRVVFVVGCSDGLLPYASAEGAEKVAEERRLFYVATTRAADHLHLSWARARQPGGRATREPSPFLAATPLAGSGGSAASVRRGSGRERRERRQKGPSKCRVCRASLVTPREHALGRCDGCSVDIDVDLLDALRAWRLETSREMGVPAYVVFTDVTLTAIAEQRPADVDALSAISGIGPRKLGQFGAAVLEIVRAYS